tara:strand:+ start:346 stop:489 length:144 start_codon:yes stop_codon:yes gene_type:complete
MLVMDHKSINTISQLFRAKAVVGNNYVSVWLIFDVFLAQSRMPRDIS